MEADWAHLPPELVTFIAEKASTTNTEYVHIRAVCKPWRRSLTSRPRHLPRQAPWLLLPPVSGRRIGTDLSFYDLEQRKTHRFELPLARDKYICGSSHGWLVLEHDHRVSLLNPVTGSSIDLPSFNGTLIYWWFAMDNPSDQHGGDDMCISKAMLSCHPSKPGCCVVAHFKSSKCALAFCRIGATNWTVLTMPNVGDAIPLMRDFTCQNNLVYTINYNSEVTTYDLHNLSVRTFASNLNNNYRHRLYLVEEDGESGGPLVVRQVDRRDRQISSVYKWFNDGQPEWRQVMDMGKRVLFLHYLNEKHTFSSANLLQLEKWRGNQICYDLRDPAAGPCHFRIYLANMESERDDVLNFVASIGVFPTTAWYTLWLTPSLI